MNELLANQIQLFKSVFKGRTDVFAIRWEKEGKSGYMPAYSYDPYMYRAHKIKGGTFQNYTDKTYVELTDREIAKHLNGEQLIGIYPMLSILHYSVPPNRYFNWYTLIGIVKIANK